MPSPSITSGSSLSVVSSLLLNTTVGFGLKLFPFLPLSHEKANISGTNRENQTSSSLSAETGEDTVWEHFSHSYTVSQASSIIVQHSSLWHTWKYLCHECQFYEIQC